MVPVFVKDQSIRIMFGRMTLFMIERMTTVRIGYSRSLMNSAVKAWPQNQGGDLPQ